MTTTGTHKMVPLLKGSSRVSAEKRKRYKLGNVYAISLPNGKFGFGRTMEDAGFAVYKHLGENEIDTPQEEEYQFIVGVYRHALKGWTIVENRPFKSDEEAYPPPSCAIDAISGQYRIYHRGEFRDATREECEGLETAAVWDASHIVDRIMGDDKWNGR